MNLEELHLVRAASAATLDRLAQLGARVTERGEGDEQMPGSWVRLRWGQRELLVVLEHEKWNIRSNCEVTDG